MKNIHLLKKIQGLRKKNMTFKDRFLLAIIALGFILLIFLIFYVIWYAYSQRSVAHFLPAEQTVAYVEFEDFVLPTKLQSTTELAKQEVENNIKTVFGIEDMSAITNWAGARFGITLIQSDEEISTPVFFIQTRSRHKAVSFFEGLALPEEKLEKTGTLRLPIYSYPQSQSFNFAFVGPFVFISNEISPLEAIQDTFEDEALAISDQEDYRKSISNLPRQSWMRGYINFQALHFENIAASNIVEPLKYAVNHLAWTVRQNQNGFHFNTFVNLNKDLLELNESFADDTRFAYKLTDYIGSENLALYIGGANLSDEWQNTLETISNLNPAYGIILESIIRAQVSKVFGDEVNLRNDLYPLFEGEYALAIGLDEESEKINLSLILSHDNQEFVETKLEKLMDGFRYLAAQFAPKLNIVTLPDGTESRELIADSSKLEESSEEYEGYDVNCMEVTGTSGGFCYTTTNELLVITNSRDLTLEAVDLSMSPQFVLSQYQPFRQAISNLSKVSDELTFVDIQRILPLISNNPYGIIAEPFLNKFDAISWVKHYFDDGVSVEGYLLIK
ncbi:DUF3352 domain-containing protein [Patescibacteria group bacterium]|nr:DUF3352 domain-containing protein [Patescibacteria group bacterium]